MWDDAIDEDQDQYDHLHRGTRSLAGHWIARSSFVIDDLLKGDTESKPGYRLPTHVRLSTDR